ncbi:MAG TPA: sugar phosphate nucleotidyltransferase [Candidatus Acidoferrales bacterium]|jgi:mannose-1-phosphate guanylyltransferase|nr:sugar phosphate nucleotidyltransferase [Candidatus Acidoferrales bacterium]
MSTKADIKDRFVIIMAGGRGERFWPLSREKMPKQLLALLGKKSFLQEAVERVLPIVPLKNIFVITNEAQLPEVRKQLPKIPKSNLIAEPVGRDTCAAVTLGAALVGARSTTGVMAVLPADHVMPDAKKFQQILGDAFDLASRGQAIVTIGIKPSEPATGYGYIRVGNELPAPDGAKKYKTTFFKAEQFVEKPNFERAIEYVNSGQYRWNAGMFVWSFVTITNGLEKHQPEMFAACQHWFKIANNPPKLAKALAKDYPNVKRISIDYALMEHAQNVIVADGALEWDDLGAWPALARHLKADPEGNCAVADFIHVDGARNIIFDARTKNKTPIAVVGLRDSILVQTDDAVLLAHKSQAQKVKELVRKLGEDAKLKKLV